MKRLKSTGLDLLKRKYSIDALLQVKFCRDEIRGIKQPEIDGGYDEIEVENRIGDYLDEIYEEYQEVAEREYGLSEEEFDYIYQVMEDIPGLIEL